MKAIEFIKQTKQWKNGGTFYKHYLDVDGIAKWMDDYNDQFKKDILTDFLDFLLKEGYCDTDVYCEPPTAIDQYLIFNKKD